jgi:TadE-like protein
MRPNLHAGKLAIRTRLLELGDDELGAALMEMAVISAVLMSIVLGIVSFGITHHQNISIEGAAREASRFGATYPIEDAGSMELWLRDVAQVAESAAIGAIGPTDPSRLICVAHGTGTNAGDFARVRVIGAQLVASAAEELGWCFENTAPPDDTVVQVQLEREGWIETIVFSMKPTLTAEATNRYERNES